MGTLYEIREVSLHLYVISHDIVSASTYALHVKWGIKSEIILVVNESMTLERVMKSSSIDSSLHVSGFGHCAIIIVEVIVRFLFCKCPCHSEWQLCTTTHPFGKACMQTNSAMLMMDVQ